MTLSLVCRIGDQLKFNQHTYTVKTEVSLQFSVDLPRVDQA